MTLLVQKPSGAKLLLQKPTGGKLVLSKIQQYPAVLGEAWGGGYFAGYISHTADGNPTHALIVAPRATGATGTGYTLTSNLQWKTSQTSTANTASTFDGVANTAAMVTAGIAAHPAAQFCVNLSIGGHTDWYLPSSLELDIAYFNLKPDTTANNVSFGVNPYAVPKRDMAYTSGSPGQTAIAAFNTSSQAFVASTHWTSTQASNPAATRIDLNTGGRVIADKDISYRVRAFRRIAL
jgi:hypothetical protein